MNTYSIIHANGSGDIVKGTKLEHNKETGQTMIYSENLCSLYELVAIVPATSFVKIAEAENKAQRIFPNIETSKDV